MAQQTEQQRKEWESVLQRHPEYRLAMLRQQQEQHRRELDRQGKAIETAFKSR